MGEQSFEMVELKHGGTKREEDVATNCKNTSITGTYFVA